MSASTHRRRRIIGNKRSPAASAALTLLIIGALIIVAFIGVSFVFAGFDYSRLTEGLREVLPWVGGGVVALMVLSFLVWLATQSRQAPVAWNSEDSADFRREIFSEEG